MQFSRKKAFFTVLLIFFALLINAHYSYKSISLLKNESIQNSSLGELDRVGDLYSYELPKMLQASFSDSSKESTFSNFTQFLALSESYWSKYNESQMVSSELGDALDASIEMLNKRVLGFSEQVSNGSMDILRKYVDEEMYADIKDLMRPLKRIQEKREKELSLYSNNAELYSYYIYATIFIAVLLLVSLWKNIILIFSFLKESNGKGLESFETKSSDLDIKIIKGKVDGIVSLIDGDCKGIEKSLDDFARESLEIENTLADAVALLEIEDNRAKDVSISNFNHEDGFNVGSSLGDIEVKLDELYRYLDILDKISDQVLLLSYNKTIEAEKDGDRSEILALMGREVRNKIKDLIGLRNDLNSAIVSIGDSVEVSKANFELFSTKLSAVARQDKTEESEFDKVLMKLKHIKPYFNASVNKIQKEAQQDGTVFEIQQALHSLSKDINAL